nr:unnamed protein product [Callosobruchus chinensis]
MSNKYLLLPNTLDDVGVSILLVGGSGVFDEFLPMFLATGDSYSAIGHNYRVGFSTAGMTVQEVCRAICK